MHYDREGVLFVLEIMARIKFELRDETGHFGAIKFALSSKKISAISN